MLWLLVVAGIAGAAVVALLARTRARALPSWGAHARSLGFRAVHSTHLIMERPGKPRCEIAWRHGPSGSGEVLDHDRTKLEVRIELDRSMPFELHAESGSGDPGTPSRYKPWRRVRGVDRKEARSLLDAIETTASSLVDHDCNRQPEPRPPSAERGGELEAMATTGSRVARPRGLDGAGHVEGHPPRRLSAR